MQRRRKEEANERENEIDEMRQRGGSLKANTHIAARENDYQRQHIKRTLSPEVHAEASTHPQRSDPYKDKSPSRSYKQVMKEKLLNEEEVKVYKQIAEEQSRQVRASSPPHS